MTEPQLNHTDDQVVTGNIAARIDRLPLTRIQYLLAGITQLYWGLMIDTDFLVGRLYPFVWQPVGITTFQYSVILAGNLGVGILAGQYLGGILSDKYGRKKVLVTSAVVDAVFLFPVALTYSFWMLLLWNILYGIGIGMMLATNNVYLHEIAPPHMRHRLAMRTQLITGVCSFLPGILGIVFVPDNWVWFIYVLVLAQIVILVPVGLFLLPESPRWLEAKGRVQEADRIVSQWEAKIQQRKGPLPQPKPARNQVVQHKRVPVGELFGGEYARRAILMVVIWCLAYAGIVYGYTTYLPTYLADEGWSSDEVFLWVSIVGASARVAAFYLASYTGEWVERKTLLVIYGLVGAVLVLALPFASKSVTIAIVVAHSPVGMLWLFNMYNYTSTIFPTRLRAVGYSWTNGIGHTAQIWAPILVIGPLFAATASQGHYGWILWVAIPGSIVPSLLIWKWGMRQSGRTLEETSSVTTS